MDRHDPAALSILLQVCKDVRPDIYVDQGDLAHLAYLSHWNLGKDMGGRAHSEDGKYIEMSLKRDHELINSWLDHIQTACRKDTKHYLLEGNHEEIMRTASMMKRYDGLDKSQFSPQASWFLRDRKIEWVPYQRYGRDGRNYVQLGKYLKIIHGHYANKNFLEQHWRHWQCNLLMGHLHTIEEKSFPSLNNHISVKSNGCLCTPEASYHRGRLNAWGQGFTVIYILPDGTFHDQLVRIIGGRAFFGGKVYTAKRERWME